MKRLKYETCVLLKVVADDILTTYNRRWTSDLNNNSLHQIWLAKYNRGYCEHMLRQFHESIPTLRSLKNTSFEPQDEMDCRLLLAETYAASGNLSGAIKQFSRISDLASQGHFSAADAGSWIQLNMMWLLITWRQLGSSHKQTQRRLKDFLHFRSIPPKVADSCYMQLQSLVADYKNPRVSLDVLIDPLMRSINQSNPLVDSDAADFRKMLKELRESII
eukprot:GHVL01034782.1.p1 GENE.GHVL01034782.1~~GHVL01034782.1.p1  ORF type:complete len:228 (-),score=51.13 GHVL01034782.1:49-705(-)